MNLQAARNMFNFMQINIIEYCLGRLKAFVGYIRTGICRVEGYSSLVTTENACKWQKKTFQSLQSLLLLNEHQQTSRYSHVCPYEHLYLREY